MIEPFMLDSWQVPLPPVSGLESDRLLWLICVMDRDDKDLPFTASLLSNALKNDGLSAKQTPFFNAIWARVSGRYHLCALRCQEEDR